MTGIWRPEIKMRGNFMRKAEAIQAEATLLDAIGRYDFLARSREFRHIVDATAERILEPLRRDVEYQTAMREAIRQAILARMGAV